MSQLNKQLRTPFIDLSGSSEPTTQYGSRNKDWDAPPPPPPRHETTKPVTHNRSNQLGLNQHSNANYMNPATNMNATNMNAMMFTNDARKLNVDSRNMHHSNGPPHGGDWKAQYENWAKISYGMPPRVLDPRNSDRRGNGKFGTPPPPTTCMEWWS